MPHPHAVLVKLCTCSALVPMYMCICTSECMYVCVFVYLSVCLYVQGYRPSRIWGAVASA